MCFSATASFTAAAGLTALGIVTLKKTQTKKEVPFGMIPLLFGIQQGLEGVVWLAIKYNNVFLNTIASNLFVYFAYILWPVLIPVSVLLLEKVIWKRNLLYFFELCGLMIGSYFIYFLIQFPVLGRVMNECIVYPTPRAGIAAFISLYIAATSLSFMVSSHTVIKWLGLVTFIFLLLTYWFYLYAFVSVWCFFSAILSFIVYFYFARSKTSRI